MLRSPLILSSDCGNFAPRYESIETVTDQLGTQPFNPSANTGGPYAVMAGVVAILDPLARVVAESGTFPLPKSHGAPHRFGVARLIGRVCRCRLNFVFGSLSASINL